MTGWLISDELILASMVFSYEKLCDMTQEERNAKIRAELKFGDGVSETLQQLMMGPNTWTRADRGDTVNSMTQFEVPFLWDSEWMQRSRDVRAHLQELGYQKMDLTVGEITVLTEKGLFPERLVNGQIINLSGIDFTGADLRHAHFGAAAVDATTRLDFKNLHRMYGADFSSVEGLELLKNLPRRFAAKAQAHHINLPPDFVQVRRPLPGERRLFSLMKSLRNLAKLGS